MSEQFEGDVDADPMTTIWLQPWCKGCQKHSYGDGRQWCEDEVWGDCEECGRKPVKYVLSPDQPARTPQGSEEANG